MNIYQEINSVLTYLTLRATFYTGFDKFSWVEWLSYWNHSSLCYLLYCLQLCYSLILLYMLNTILFWLFFSLKQQHQQWKLLLDVLEALLLKLWRKQRMDVLANICGDAQALKGHHGQYLYLSLSFLILWRLLDCFVLYVCILD